MGEAVGEAVGDAVGDEVGEEVGEEVGDDVGAIVGAAGGAQVELPDVPGPHLKQSYLSWSCPRTPGIVFIHRPFR